MTRAPIPHEDAVRAANSALEGPVVRILAQLVPAIADLPRDKAYERIMDDLVLLERCFAAFHTHMDRFRPLLIDADGKPVRDAAKPLFCGRSLNQIVAMVVRTAAKRHFRLTMDHDVRPLRRQPAKPRRKDLFARLRQAIGAEIKPVRIYTPAGELYRALTPLLRHDWQVPLLREYAQLTPGVVRKLGKRLLDYRVPEDVRRARMNPDYPPPPTSIAVMEALHVGVFQGLPDDLPPAPPPAPRATEATRGGGTMAPAPEMEAQPAAEDRRAPLDNMLNDDGTRLRPSAFDELLFAPKIQAVLPDTALSLRVGEALGRVGAPIARQLVDGLDLDSAQLTVFLMTAQAALGDKAFDIGFGIPGRPGDIDQIIKRGKAAGIGEKSSLSDVAGFVARVFRKT